MKIHKFYGIILLYKGLAGMQADYVLKKYKLYQAISDFIFENINKLNKALPRIMLTLVRFTMSCDFLTNQN